MKICEIHGILYEGFCPSCEQEVVFDLLRINKRANIRAYRAGVKNEKHSLRILKEEIEKEAFMLGLQHRKYYKNLDILVEKGE